MKNIALLLMIMGFTQCVGPIKENKKPLNVLVVTDARKFNREAFFAMFDSFEDIHWTEKAHPGVLDLFGSDSIHLYDAVVFYDMPEKVELSDDHKKNMLAYFKKGTPVVFLHHSILSYRPWDEFRDIIGGRYYNAPAFVTENGDSILSEYEHDVRFNVQIADHSHPITKGIDDFEIFDETYNNFFIEDDVKILLTTDHPKSSKTIGWINKYGNSQVVYLMNGHNETAYENPNYRQLLYNTIRWVASNKN